MKRFGARGDHFREVPNWGRSLLRVSMFFFFPCFCVSEKPPKKRWVTPRASVRSLNTASLYNLAVDYPALRLDLLRRSSHPSLIHTNHRQSTHAHNHQQHILLTHTHTHTHSLTQVCNCNQAHSLVFTTERFSPKMWRTEQSLAIKKGVI